MTDYAKTIYDDLVANWAGDTATIRYLRDKSNINEISTDILIEVDQGGIEIESVGLTTGDKMRYKNIIHVYLEVHNKNTVILNKQYLRTVLGQFDTWISARAYDDTWIYTIIPDPDITKYRLDIWLKAEEFI